MALHNPLPYLGCAPLEGNAFRPTKTKPIVIAALAGAVAGIIHVLAGPDHLAAVAPLTVARREQGWTTGLRWGLGHAGGVILVGVLSLVLREVLPVERFSAWAERFVGVVLIAIGIWGVRKAMRHQVHVHEHSHGGTDHVHIHVHATAAAHHHHPKGGHSHTHAAFAVGTLHGLAGGSHFLGVLPALAFPTTAQAVSYLLAFGLGTVLAMMGFSSTLAWTARRLAFNGTRAYQVLMMACSLAATGLGAYWLVG